jgi:hypothetical protein
MQEWESEFAWASFPTQVDWPTRGIRSGEGGADALEIVWGIGGSHSVSDLRTVWSARSNNGRRNNPVVAIHLAGEDGPASLVGPGREGVLPPVAVVNDVTRLTRLLDSALTRPNRFRAREHLERYLPSVDDPAWGVRNRGLFATHSLLNTPEYHDGWGELAATGRPMLQSRGSALAEQLGFSITPGSGGRYSILSVEGEPTALGLFLPADEGPRTHVARFGDSPVLYGFRMADEHDLPWIIVNAGDRLQIYSTKPNIGVGRRGRTETYTEVLLDLLAPQDAGYVPLLFSSEALRAGGYLEELIRRSAERVTDLGTRLRDRVYNDVLPRLATGIAVARGLQDPTIDELRTTQGMALSTLFRMLFISYAEDRDLLPYKESADYQESSLKKLALEWSTEEPEFEDSSSALWDRLATITRAVHNGSETLQIPAYGGTPFSADPNIAPLGHLLEGIHLPDSIFGPALRALITDVSAEEGLGPIDFRELSVREFGTIYEGLLESELACAETDLATDRKGFYRPANQDEEVIVRKGEFYLSNGGQRKSSASFYTKEFAVEHLLERSLEPALDDHLARIDALETDQEKSEAFFDFMIADISMGSGHFLVAAVDRIERRFSSYLDENPLEGVRTELNRLWNLAAKALGKSVDETGINQPMLLRRQIARRCIYGVDLNPTAVELARVSIWIHTFVPGLPLSFLDWHLRQGNSVVGIATQSEAWDVIIPTKVQTTLTAFAYDFVRKMNEIMSMMLTIARQSDASISEVDLARKAHRDAFVQLEPWEALMDIITASRINTAIEENLQTAISIWSSEPEAILTSQILIDARLTLEGLDAFHHQVMFPEVMWREDPGFDVIVGNPPWEKLKVEVNEFLSRYVPGFKGLSATRQRDIAQSFFAENKGIEDIYLMEREVTEKYRKAIINSGTSGISSGDPELYQSFCIQFLQLLRSSGRLAVVLPRSAFASKGNAEFRKNLVQNASHTSVMTLENKKKWLFDIDPRLNVVFLDVRLGDCSSTLIQLFPLIDSYEKFIKHSGDSNTIPLDYITNLSPIITLPSLPIISQQESLNILEKISRFPNTITNDPWGCELYSDFHPSKIKKILRSEPDSDSVTIITGGSIDKFKINFNSEYGYIPKQSVDSDLIEKLGKERIFLRRIASSTNTRTIICGYSSGVLSVENAQAVKITGQFPERIDLFLLGVFNSLVFDWVARRYIETTVNKFIFENFRIPRDFDDSSFNEICSLVEQQIDCFDSDTAAKIDSLVCGIYGLSVSDVEVICSTFHHDGTIEGKPWEERYVAIKKHIVEKEEVFE